MPGAGHPRAVEADQLSRDLLDRLLRLRLGLGPVGAAHPVEGGRLAADVAGDLVELVGRHVEAVALGVLDDEVLAGGALHGALDHLDVAADSVLLVHDVVADPELERVDHVAPPARQPAHVLGAGLLPHQVEMGEDGELGRDEAVLDQPGADVHDLGLGRRVQVSRQAGGHVHALEQLDHPLGGGPCPR
ncbi:hypothetical protein GCM10020219_094230 [Nonomuraea dietziae]